MRIATEQGFSHMLWWGTFLRRRALVEQGRREEGLAQMRETHAAILATGAEAYWTGYLALFGEAYGAMGQATEGLTRLGEALAVVHRTGERYTEAELYRLKGELTLQSQTRLQHVSDKAENSDP